MNDPTDGWIVKRDHRLVGVEVAAARATVDRAVKRLHKSLGDGAWEKGMHPGVRGSTHGG